MSPNAIPMIRPFLLCLLLLTNGVQTALTINRGYEAFQLLKETAERDQHGTQCLPPSKYFAGSCYTYMKASPAPSWERAYNNCLSLPMTTDARLLAVESVDEYEFIERDLIGLKSGSESVSVYIGLRKINNTWYWSNDVPLKETPVYRYWVDNNRDILAYDCGILWLARNTSVITPAPCVEQALRPYVCKQTIDRCYNKSGTCGKYGKCINQPLTNSYQCRCRFFYTGDRCENWSSQGLQVIVGSVIVLIAFVISYIINIDRSDDCWSFRKSTYRQYQHAHNSSRMADHALLNSDFLNTLTSDEKHRWCTSSPRLNQPQRSRFYSFDIHKFLIEPKRLVLIILSLILTTILCIIILNARDLIQDTAVYSTRLFQFCLLYQNNYYHNLLTLPIALVILLLIIINQTRQDYYRFNRERFSIYIPIPYNPFSKINRFDTMILCGVLSHEILEILEEIFLRTTQMKVLTMNGPLFDLIRQIGLIIIVALRYYPVYSVLEMSKTNILYYALCAFYMWLDLILRMFEQTFCMNINPFLRTWRKAEELKNDFTTQSLLTTTTMFMPEYDDYRSSGFKGRFHRIKDRLGFRQTRLSTATIQPFTTSSMPIRSLNWSSIDFNMTATISRNDSQSIFDQFSIDPSIVSALKYAPYYLCLTYICIRFTYLTMVNIYRSISCRENENNALKKPLKHIYHEPTFSSKEDHSIEYAYVRHLLQKSHQILRQNSSKCYRIRSLLSRIYRTNKHFYYSKQILNLYMIASMLIYYLTFNILQNGFYLIEKIYNFTFIPLLLVYEELVLPEPKASHLKYEMLLACSFTAMIYFGQLFFGMKNYQRHMLDAYKGIFIDIPPRSAFRNVRLLSKNIHYPGYCIAYLTVGYVVIGNLLFFLLIGLRVLLKHLFLIEELAKVFVPLLAIYLTKFILEWFLSRTFFLEKHGKTTVLKNQRLYFVFSYFNFFFDCFLGMISCTFRLSKAWLAVFLFQPRLDYCILGRPLEKLDSGFISYASFIHMECLHTHPVLIYFCSLANEQMNQRSQYLQTSKRDMYSYTNHQRIVFRWWLAITLTRNMQLRQLRKHHAIHSQLSSEDSLNDLSVNRIFPHFSNPTATRKGLNSTTVLCNHSTTCTTLLLDVDEQDDRKRSF